jgi:lipoprotein-releasing system permease protein
MNSTLVSQLALRYLRGKRSANIVPILSRVSMGAIAVGSCAMIVLFSVFNGFEYLVRDLYKAFYPEIKISAAKGKFFELNDSQLSGIKNTEGLHDYTAVLEDNVLLNSSNEQKVATLKGIDKNYFQINNIKPYIQEGTDSVTGYPAPTAIVGKQLMDQLGLEINNAFNTIMIYYPNAQSSNLALNPESAFQSLQIKPSGAFKIQDDFDSKYILASLPVVQQLLQAEGKYSAIEIKLNENADAADVKHLLQKKLGNRYIIETRFEQNKTLYIVMHAEKWAVYAILLLVLLIASFNMVGALSLLVLEKQKDIAILKAMGARSGIIKTIFISEGMLWSLVGGLIGLIIGILICLGQQHYHWIKMGGAFIIDAYPVHFIWTDFFLILITVVGVAILAAWFPAMRATKTSAISLRSN